MSSYRHYIYLSDNFPERIKKARENKPVEEKVSTKISRSNDLDEDTPVVLVKTNLLPRRFSTHKGKH